MKLIIQIPCFNEAETLPETIRALPRQIEGIDIVEYLVVDDGSNDGTVEVALSLGVHYVIRLPKHQGLARGFVAGLEACLINGADIIVNTDADNQYRADDIQKLISPILVGKADLVVGDRGLANQKDYSKMKRALQRLGSWVLEQASGVHIPDATSGFRAISRQAALRTIILSEHSYTLKSLIQAGSHRMAIEYVPIRTNPQTRPSRLIRNLPEYLALSTATIIRSYMMYRALRLFTILGSIFIAAGIFLGVRFIFIKYILLTGTGNIQSLILAAVSMIVGFQIILIGFLADMVGFNRKILEETLFRIRNFELNQQSHNSSKQS